MVRKTVSLLKLLRVVKYLKTIGLGAMRYAEAVDFLRIWTLGWRARIPANDSKRIWGRLIGSSENEFNERNARWGMADTYGRTRRIPKLGGYSDRNRRNDPKRTSMRGNRASQKW